MLICNCLFAKLFGLNIVCVVYNWCDCGFAGLIVWLVGFICCVFALQLMRFDVWGFDLGLFLCCVCLLLAWIWVYLCVIVCYLLTCLVWRNC